MTMSNFSRDYSRYSRETLAERRRNLRRQRGWKVLRTIWRTIVVSGMAGGLVWTLTLRFWVLNSPEQVQIQGTERLSPDTIRDLLSLRYPLSLLHVEPQTLVHVLESSAPIAHAAVNREVMPPRLVVQVQERQPVAQAALTPSSPSAGQDTWGLLDERGFWIPLEQFTNLQSEEDLPSLKVLGMRPELQGSWASLYQIIRESPIEITEVDWRDPNNLMLQTELGLVHFGSYGVNFAEQIQSLDRLRNLPEHPQFSQINYIDLRNPETPYLHFTPSASPPQSPSSTPSSAPQSPNP
ncbi:MAG: cell division protein FtsQ/DivIB [Prochlorotrichaceae cyanobacterium]